MFELFNGTKRFGELRRRLHPISPKTLTDRLQPIFAAMWTWTQQYGSYLRNETDEGEYSGTWLKC
ncbi:MULTISPECIES: winged helix-turn-helix transcriptional regulator [Paenibacillus]|uniref:HTH hxlR-type domain-containing protein n=1 Tax=Paenibacillus woosongensis TaxID=307580 RepID=A0ABQ4MJN0_9BACL|nr:winged helix-turn-helix transcriptional regulator [Paenibacillus woosongensis]GIP56189.1 hypothetical protein J15TS10_00030 [Paenibacillus woosongensis]